jgi:hypothetical protein
MGKLFGAVLFLIFLVGAYFFVKQWKSTSSWGASTGTIARREGVKPTESTPARASSLIAQISQNPQKFAGKRVSVSGRVRGNSKYASNRNLYRLTDGKYSLMVVDDKAAPKEYWPRAVTGTVKVIKPPLGNGYAYIVNVKGNPNINLKWQDVKSFFGEKIEGVKTEAQRALR